MLLYLKLLTHNIVFREIMDYILKGPVFVMELLADNAITAWNKFIGPKEDKDVVSNAPLSLIARYEKSKYDLICVLNKIIHKLHIDYYNNIVYLT